MEITSSEYMHPTDASQSFVVLNMVLGAVKRSVPEFNTIANFNKADETVLINLGAKVMKGKEKPEVYSNKVISVVEKMIKKKIQNKSYLNTKIQDYIKRDIMDTQEQNPNKLVNTSLLKEYLERHTGKKIIFQENIDEKIKLLDSELKNNLIQILEEDSTEVLEERTLTFPTNNIVVEYEKEPSEEEKAFFELTDLALQSFKQAKESEVYIFKKVIIKLLSQNLLFINKVLEREKKEPLVLKIEQNSSHIWISDLTGERIAVIYFTNENGRTV